MEIPREVMVEAVVKAMTEDESKILTDLVREALMQPVQGGQYWSTPKPTVLEQAVQNAALNVVRARVDLFLGSGEGSEIVERLVRERLSEQAITELVDKVTGSIEVKHR